ncbi:MAG: hypothetical protein JW928_00530 [Candidatus Aureabacteria bacterium]|nr:hypothetical protein [Candidatus Auribacterota bacterium]
MSVLVQNTVLFILMMYLSKPAILPLVNQNDVPQPVSTKDLSHPFVRYLEKRYDEANKEALYPDRKTFCFFSCEAGEKEARLSYTSWKEEEGLDESGKVLLVLFEKKESVWEVVVARSVNVETDGMDEKTGFLQDILMRYKDFLLSSEK